MELVTCWMGIGGRRPVDNRGRRVELVGGTSAPRIKGQEYEN
jgi:hypothetical protein